VDYDVDDDAYSDSDIDTDFEINAEVVSSVDKLCGRNERLRRLFLFDARLMLLSQLCSDECGVVWSYFIERDDTDGIAVLANVNADGVAVLVNADVLRVDFSAVVEERRRRAAPAVREVADDVAGGDGRDVKRRRANR
jgi:hypothetical protein